MKLAFSGKGRYTDYSAGFELYNKRAKKETIDFETYKKIIKRYCELLSEKLYDCGIIDLPADLGLISAAIITRRPQYRGKKFIGYGKIDWQKKQYDGQLKTFGVVYLPKRGKNENLRCLGFVANRKLFKRLKSKYENDSSCFPMIDFNNEMI